MISIGEETVSADTQTLATRLIETVPLIMRYMFRNLHETDHRIEPNQLRILAMLADQQCNLSELAAKQAVSLPSMSKTVNMLVERGWIERTEAPQDRRMVRLCLTAQGRSALQEVHQAMIETTDAALSRLGPDERATLAAGLELLHTVFAAAPCPQDATPPPAGFAHMQGQSATS